MPLLGFTLFEHSLGRLLVVAVSRSLLADFALFWVKILHQRFISQLVVVSCLLGVVFAGHYGLPTCRVVLLFGWRSVTSRLVVELLEGNWQVCPFRHAPVN
jgi:hypothetical protein